MKKVAIVASSYNSSDDTHTFLKSLKKIKKDDFTLDIIIIDNASKEPFVFTSEESELPVTLITLQVNIGFTGAYDTGMKKALELGADYVMVVNNDTILYPDTVVELLKVLESDKKIACAVPKIYFAKGHEFHKDRYTKSELGHVLWYAGGSVDWNNVFTIHRGVDEVDTGQYDQIEPVGFATGCCMFLTKEVIEKVGMFDEKFFLYYEDADLNERIKRAGYTIYYVPTARLIHVNASTTGIGSPIQDYYISRNQMIFGMRYASLRTKFALIRQSIRYLVSGRPMQRKGIIDFYLGNLNKGSY